MEKKEKGLACVPVDRLLTTDEVAEALGGTTPKFVNRIIKAGLLIALHFGRSRRVPTSVLNRFIKDFAGRDIVAEVERIEAGRKSA